MAPRPTWPMPAQPPVQAGARSVLLRCQERARLLVRGPLSGRAYEFSAEHPAVAVDARDADVLLRTRRFVRA